MMILRFVAFLCFLCTINCASDWSGDKDPQRWNDYAFDKIQANLKKRMNTNLAKNVILFLGDGMGISTITGGRIMKGQLKNQTGEEVVTNMEDAEFTGLSKVIRDEMRLILSSIQVFRQFSIYNCSGLQYECSNTR